MLTVEEKQELDTLRSIQKRTDVVLFQDQFDRIKELSSKQYDGKCLNPVCEASYEVRDGICTGCTSPVHKHKK